MTARFTWLVVGEGASATAAWLTHVLQAGGLEVDAHLSRQPLVGEADTTPAGRRGEPVVVVDAATDPDGRWSPDAVLVAGPFEDTGLLARARLVVAPTSHPVAHPCPVYVGVDLDGPVSPTWWAAPLAARSGAQPFELFIGGTAAGTVLIPRYGTAEVMRATLAIAAAAQGHQLPVPLLLRSVRSFEGVRGDQEWVASVAGVHVIRDDAASPSAVHQALTSARSLAGDNRLTALLSLLTSPFEEVARASADLLIGTQRPIEDLSVPLSAAENRVFEPISAGDVIVCFDRDEPDLSDRLIARLVEQLLLTER